MCRTGVFSLLSQWCQLSKQSPIIQYSNTIILPRLHNGPDLNPGPRHLLKYFLLILLKTIFTNIDISYTLIASQQSRAESV